MLCKSVLVGVTLASAVGVSTATDLRLGDHAAFVRAVVDYPGGGLAGNRVEAADPEPFDGAARLRVQDSQLARGLTAIARSRYGLTVRVVQARGRALRIDLRAGSRRFKYVSYEVVTGNRLAIDLWKSPPPTRAAEVRRGAGGCLSLDSVRVARPGLVTAAGSERNLPEHQFRVVVRGRDGGVLAQVAKAASGRWGARLSYRATRRQPGTLEAVALSLKDGAVACLVQARVTLPAHP